MKDNILRIDTENIQEIINNWALEVIARLIKEGKLEDSKEEKCPTQT